MSAYLARLAARVGAAPAAGLRQLAVAGVDVSAVAEAARDPASGDVVSLRAELPSARALPTAPPPSAAASGPAPRLLQHDESEHPARPATSLSATPAAPFDAPQPQAMLRGALRAQPAAAANAGSPSGAAGVVAATASAQGPARSPSPQPQTDHAAASLAAAAADAPVRARTADAHAAVAHPAAATVVPATAPPAQPRRPRIDVQIGSVTLTVRASPPAPRPAPVPAPTAPRAEPHSGTRQAFSSHRHYLRGL